MGIVKEGVAAAIQRNTMEMEIKQFKVKKTSSKLSFIDKCDL